MPTKTIAAKLNLTQLRRSDVLSVCVYFDVRSQAGRGSPTAGSQYPAVVVDDCQCQLRQTTDAGSSSTAVQTTLFGGVCL